MSLALRLIARDLFESRAPVLVDPMPPDPSDPGKMLIDGKPARVIPHFDGWHVPIVLGWFQGSFDPPAIQRSSFHWYVFAIPRLRGRIEDHYFVCDYLQMREWVLEFTGPKGRDHRDHNRWRADFRLKEEEKRGCFCWGDESASDYTRPGRAIALDNIASVALLRLQPNIRIGNFVPTGECSAHRALKLYVAGKPGLIGLTDRAVPEVEHCFVTGDRVDILFNNHAPMRTVVEIEIEGEREITTGIHQAIKYRSLAEAESGFPRLSPQVRAVVVAFETEYQRVQGFASSYGVELMTVDRVKVLGAVG